MLLLLLHPRFSAVVTTPCGRVLTATPAVANAITASLVVLLEGVFPGDYPGADSYPGRGSTLGATQAVSRVLTATENC